MRFLGCAVLVLLAASAGGTIHKYENKSLPADEMIYRHSALFSPEDAPYRAEATGGISRVKVDLTFTRVNKERHKGDKNLNVQVAFFPSSSFDSVGYLDKKTNKRLYCCSPDQAKFGLCSTPYSLTYDDSKEDVVVEQISFDDSDYAFLDTTFFVDSSDMYYLMFVSCNEAVGEVTFDGHTEWLNPYGYLPGELYGYLPFYTKISLLYLVVATVWTIACWVRWKNLTELQNLITLVLALGMVEMSMRFMDFALFNKHGVRSNSLMVFASLMRSLKKTASRGLILVVSMGYGVARPTLGDAKHKVIVVCVAYFLFSTVQHVAEGLGHSSQKGVSLGEYLLMLPVAAIDTLLYFWVFMSLQATLTQVKSRQQAEKTKLYLRFRAVLVCAFLMSVFFSLIFVHAVTSNKLEAEWKTRWIYEGFFDAEYFLVLVPLMWVFRPTLSEEAYMYNRVVQTDEFGLKDDDSVGGQIELSEDLKEIVEVRAAVPGKNE